MNYQNLLYDFVERTRHNLEIIQKYRVDNNDAFEVTQLINSMLGLIVLPIEKYYDHIDNKPVSELRAQGWPEAILTQENDIKPGNLKKIIKLMRHSVAHANIQFKELNGKIDGVILINKCKCGKTTWRAELSIEELENIIKKFVDLILNSK